MSHTGFTGATVDARLTALFAPGVGTTLASSSALRLMTGSIAGHHVLVAATDPHADKGVLGISECADLRRTVQKARENRTPLVLLIDSAGARLDDGLPIQGALRGLMRELLDASLDGLPSIALLGRNVFGGASMLAFATSQRCYAPTTLLAMSGPRVLQAGGGDERAIVIEAIDGMARSRHGDTERLLDDSLTAYADALRDWLVAHSLDAPAASIAAERRHLAQRLSTAPQPVTAAIEFEPAQGPLSCRGQAFVGTADVLKLATLAEAASGPLTLHLDCAGHSVRLGDERLILSQYLVHLAKTLRQRVRAGHPVHLTIAGEISGGIYIAAAGAASTVRIAPGGSVRTLPQSSLDNILNRPAAASADFAHYVEFGVADTVSPQP